MILIDQSTGSKDLINYPPLDDPCLACLTSLSFSDSTKSAADICFTGNGPHGKLSIGIEFKSLADLISSSNDGRLQSTQIPSMLESYDLSYLLYYGLYRCNPSGILETFHKSKWTPYTFIGNKPLPYGYLESFLLTVQAIGINIKHVSTIDQCAQWVGCLYRWWSKPWAKHKSMRTFDKSSSMSPSLVPGLSPHTKQMIETAKSYPGLGFERALAAAQYFPSIEVMTNASVSEWENVPGVGRVVAKAVHSAIRSKSQSKPKPKPVPELVTGLDVDLDLLLE
jgi:hypothetical protein